MGMGMEWAKPQNSVWGGREKSPPRKAGWESSEGHLRLENNNFMMVCLPLIHIPQIY